MEYNKLIHIPARIESLLKTIEDEGKLEQFDQILDNLTGLIDNNGFKDTIVRFRGVKDKEFKDIEEKTVKMLRNATQNGSYVEIEQSIEDAEVSHQRALQNAVMKYISAVRDYVLSYSGHVDIAGFE